MQVTAIVLAWVTERRRSLVVIVRSVMAAIALCCGLGAAFAQQKEASPEARIVGAIPNPEVLAALVRWTMVAISQANVTGNYTVLRELGSPAFQAANTSAKLAVVFSGIRDQNVDLSFAVTATPQLSQTPTVSPKGVLKVVGFYPTRPLQINFDFSFEPINGIWRHSDIGLAAGPPMSASTAPETKAAPEIKAPAEARKPAPKAPASK